MSTAKINKYIGAGIKDVITPQEIQDLYDARADFGMSEINGKWQVDSAVPSATKGTIAESDIVIEFSHDIDLSNDDEGTRSFDEDGYTVSDMIVAEFEKHESNKDAEEDD